MLTATPQCSLLYADPAALAAFETATQPGIFTDLNLDQVVDEVCLTRAAYALQQYFYLPLRSAAEVIFRQRTLADLANPEISACISAFAEAMQAVRARQKQAADLHYRYQREWWLLQAAAEYCDAIRTLAGTLARLPLTAEGLTRFRAYLRSYTAAPEFVAMERDTAAVREALAGIDYSVRVHGATVTVDDYRGDSDYSAEVLATFDRFRQGATRSHLVVFGEHVAMNHVEAQILDRVALLHPEAFAALDRHAAAYGQCIDATIANVERETQFFQAYLEFVEPMVRAGLPVTVPEVSATAKGISASDTFDIALAGLRMREHRPVVCNDLSLRGGERLIVVSGPNQGGKTTFSRMFGQLHYLASLGLSVPGREVRLFLPDRIFTHYERGENLANHRSKLEDELIRIHDILGAATPNSVIVINEIFSSTTLSDAIFLGTRVIRAIVKLDCLCLCVTFIDELASLSDSTVSMVSTVVPDNPAERTFKVIRQPADGLAYAAAIAQKYGLGYRQLVERIAS